MFSNLVPGSLFHLAMLDQCFATISTFTSNNVGSVFCHYLNIHFQQCWISVLPLSQHSLPTMLDVGSNFVRWFDQGFTLKPFYVLKGSSHKSEVHTQDEDEQN